jgi:hypothetical protein
MPAALAREVRDGFPQPDPTAAAARHPGESLVDGRPVGEGLKFHDEVLLQRLSTFFGAFP